MGFSVVWPRNVILSQRSRKAVPFSISLRFSHCESKSVKSSGLKRLTRKKIQWGLVSKNFHVIFHLSVTPHPGNQFRSLLAHRKSCRLNQSFKISYWSIEVFRLRRYLKIACFQMKAWSFLTHCLALPRFHMILWRLLALKFTIRQGEIRLECKRFQKVREHMSWTLILNSDQPIEHDSMLWKSTRFWHRRSHDRRCFGLTHDETKIFYYLSHRLRD